MRVRKISALVVAGVAVSLSLTACGGGSTGGASTSSSSSASAPATADAKSGQGTADTTSAGTPKQSGVKCTDQQDYAGDPRSNAEINSIGEDTGYCPQVQH